MFLVVTGGSGSGKSAYAEERALGLEPGEKIYIATMEPYDEESFRRIDRHRSMRARKNFRTLECYRHLEEVEVDPSDTILLECMSNLTANEMFSPEGRGMDCADAILEGVLRLAERSRHLIVVTNNVFGDGSEVGEGSRKYLEVLGEINCRMAEAADEAVEVICGIPVFLKKETGRRNL